MGEDVKNALLQQLYNKLKRQELKVEATKLQISLVKASK